jgi:hypothetical protein
MSRETTERNERIRIVAILALGAAAVLLALLKSLIAP